MIRIPTDRAPTHPGEMLLEEFLRPLSLTPSELASAIHIPQQRINAIVNQHQGITPSIALRLAKVFNMSPDFWLNLQIRWDLYHAQQQEQETLNTIRAIALSTEAMG